MKANSRPNIKKYDIPLKKALKLTLENIKPIKTETVFIPELAGRITAKPVKSLVNTPSSDISLKDGYAVISADVMNASKNKPIVLALKGSLMAGSSKNYKVVPGTAVRIMSGATIPKGADAVVAVEFTETSNSKVTIFNHAENGRNILKKGSDVKRGEIITESSRRLWPPAVGLIAASGHDRAVVFKNPSVSIIATGDEILAVGQPLVKGKVFASNLVTISSWCTHYGMESETSVVKDSESEIKKAIKEKIKKSDSLITSGGAWKGDRDLVVKILDDLGWKKIYHRVKMGPGKAIGFGLLNSKPVFCLPGGPPSNQMAFLQLALPGLLRLAGHSSPKLPEIEAVIEETVYGQKDWTQFIHGILRAKKDKILFKPLKMTSRLQFMAKADAIACIPEGTEKIDNGSKISVQLISAL
ncbi:MAG: molybdopterin molybdotransferase MoeA [Nitrospirae bacterium]|nr:molybdopterin molybdotransferase MoeA [Nitrospirota bacterium]